MTSPGPRRHGMSDQAADAAVGQACQMLRLPSIRSQFNDIVETATREQLSYRASSIAERHLTRPQYSATVRASTAGEMTIGSQEPATARCCRGDLRRYPVEPCHFMCCPQRIDHLGCTSILIEPRDVTARLQIGQVRSLVHNVSYVLAKLGHRSQRRQIGIQAICPATHLRSALRLRRRWV